MKNLDEYISEGCIYWCIGGLGLIGGIIIGALLPGDPLKKAYPAPDLNRDGIADIVVEERSHKYPLFGVMEGNKLVYLPASKMEENQKDSVVKVDYQRIEDLLNQE